MHFFCNSEIIFLNTTQILSQRTTLSTKKYWREEVQDSYKQRVTKSSNIFCSVCPSAGAEAKRFLQSKNPSLEHLSQILMLVILDLTMKAGKINLLKNFTRSLFLPVAIGRGRKEFICRPLLITALAMWHSSEKRWSHKSTSHKLLIHAIQFIFN